MESSLLKDKEGLIPMNSIKSMSYMIVIGTAYQIKGLMEEDHQHDYYKEWKEKRRLS